jgi:hypothetical protein
MIRTVAREMAEDIYRETIRGMFGLIVNRIEWRRANAHLLALEAERMVYLLAHDQGFVAFRRARLNHWRRVERKHSARAWASDRVLSAALSQPVSSDEQLRMIASLRKGWIKA